MKTFAKASILIVLAGTAGFGYYYFFVRLPQPNVGLEFSKPDQTLLGQPFSISVSFSNYSDQILKNAKLSVLLPDGVSFLNDSPDKRVSEQAVGTRPRWPRTAPSGVRGPLGSSSSPSSRRFEARLGA